MELKNIHATTEIAKGFCIYVHLKLTKVKHSQTQMCFLGVTDVFKYPLGKFSILATRKLMSSEMMPKLGTVTILLKIQYMVVFDYT